jgi:murein DD-endopeptidase MepM/ murein hydrolase activator NlpD
VANHRAERRTPSRRSDASRAGALNQTNRDGTAASSEAAPPPGTTTGPAVNIGPGKRRAVKPARAGKVAARNGHTGGRKSLFPALPSAPTLIGAAALAFAAVGATISQHSTELAGKDYDKFAAQASVLNSASSMGSGDALSGRQRAVSRDSQREALQDAADAELLAAAESQAKERNAALAALAADAEKHAKVIAANAWSLPLPAGTYQVNHNFGHCSYLWANCHTGEDLSAPSGTPIFSVAAGTVTETGYDGAYGNKTVVTLEDGTEVWYCHQTTILASVGDSVRSGEQIGTVGSTGHSTGPHLHIEVRPGAGDAVDPVSALAARGVTL